MAQIFISYSRKDRDIAESIYTRLNRVYSNRVFYDAHLEVGDDWWNRLLAEIEASKVFIYIISNNALASYHCRAEFLEAMRLGKPIIPVLIQHNPDFNLAPESVAFVIKRLQWIELIRGRGDDNGLIARINRELFGDAAAPAQQRSTYQNIINERDLSGENVNLGGTQNITINNIFSENQPIPQPAFRRSHQEQPRQRLQ